MQLRIPFPVIETFEVMFFECLKKCLNFIKKKISCEKKLLEKYRKIENLTNSVGNNRHGLLHSEAIIIEVCVRV